MGVGWVGCHSPRIVGIISILTLPPTLVVRIIICCFPDLCLEMMRAIRSPFPNNSPYCERATYSGKYQSNPIV
eukprot:scaffold4954_cov193-Amphora_coffeaeformis.AAC.2